MEARPEEEGGETDNGSRWQKVAPLVGLAGVGGLLWYSGAIDHLTDPVELRRWIGAAGPLAPVAFILMLVPLNLLFLAGLPIWISTSLFPMPQAIAYSIVGAVAASAGAHLLARYLGAEWARARIPRNLHRFTDRLRSKPLQSVATLRVLLWINPGVDLLMAVAGVRLRDFLIGTVVGISLPTAIRVYAGKVGIEAAMGSNPWFWAALAAVIALLVVRRWRATRSSAASA